MRNSFVSEMSTMKTAGSILLATLLFVPAGAHAAPQRQIIGTTQDHSSADSIDCDNFHTQTYTSFPAKVRDQEQREIPLGAADVLKINSTEEGGVSVRGWDRPFARVITCKHAVAETKGQAKKVLGDIRVTARPGEIGSEGPDVDATHVWWVNVIVFAPKNANLDITTENGGIAVRNMTGRVNAHSVNGGISLAQCTGENKVSSENGGVTLDKVSSGGREARRGGGAVPNARPSPARRW
ncbi:MAG TPA: hypothetical protein VFN10_08405 [Thermoanaerobaculia bacterium]|nr:hypothetical protein [Thermoanaerobaculia bacterium]